MQSTTDSEFPNLTDGFRISQPIYIAANTGLADLIAGGPESSIELAGRLTLNLVARSPLNKPHFRWRGREMDEACQWRVRTAKAT
jgi:hypothetical protein